MGPSSVNVPPRSLPLVARSQIYNNAFCFSVPNLRARWRHGRVQSVLQYGPAQARANINLRRSARSDHETELTVRSPGGADASSSFFVIQSSRKKSFYEKNVPCPGVLFWGPGAFFRPFPCPPPYTSEVGVPMRGLKILAKLALPVH